MHEKRETFYVKERGGGGGGDARVLRDGGVVMGFCEPPSCVR